MMEYVGHTNESLCLIPTLAIAAQKGGRPWLVCGSEDHALCIWSIRKSKKPVDNGNCAETGETCCQRIPGRNGGHAEGDGHYGPVLCAHGHAKVATVATGSKDSTIKLWKDVIT